MLIWACNWWRWAENRFLFPNSTHSRVVNLINAHGSLPSPRSLSLVHVRVLVPGNLFPFSSLRCWPYGSSTFFLFFFSSVKQFQVQGWFNSIKSMIGDVCDEATTSTTDWETFFFFVFFNGQNVRAPWGLRCPVCSGWERKKKLKCKKAQALVTFLRPGRGKPMVNR